MFPMNSVGFEFVQSEDDGSGSVCRGFESFDLPILVRSVYK